MNATLKRVLESQDRLEEQQKGVEKKLEDLTLIKEKIERTHELQKESSNTTTKLPDLLKALNSFTEAALKKDKDSKKPKIVNTTKRRTSKKNEEESDDEFQP
jgi:hypothetical protein